MEREKLREAREQKRLGLNPYSHITTAIVLFLLSNAADYVTGSTVTVDGGLSLTVAQGA